MFYICRKCNLICSTGSVYGVYSLWIVWRVQSGKSLALYSLFQCYILFGRFIVFEQFGHFGGVLGSLINGFSACQGLSCLKGLECLKGYHVLYLQYLKLNLFLFICLQCLFIVFGVFGYFKGFEAVRLSLYLLSLVLMFYAISRVQSVCIIWKVWRGLGYLNEWVRCYGLQRLQGLECLKGVTRFISVEI